MAESLFCFSFAAVLWKTEKARLLVFAALEENTQ